MPANLSKAKPKPTRSTRSASSTGPNVGSGSGTDAGHGLSRTPLTHWQPASRGTLQAEYAIYLAAAQDLGWPVKTFDEWLAS